MSLGGRAILRHASWTDPVGLWSEAVDRAPDQWFPRLLLAQALHEAGRHDEAVGEYESGIRLRPEDLSATFERLRQIHPDSRGLQRIGHSCAADGASARGARFFLTTLAHDRENVTARQSLAVIGEMEPMNAAEALRLCEEIQRLAPRTPGNDDCINRNRAGLAATAQKSR